MATQADVRRIALSLPQVRESPGHFAFSVTGRGKPKGFAWVWLERVLPRKPRVPQPRVIALRVASLEDKEFLLGLDPAKFFTEPHYNGFPAVLVRLPAVTAAELRPLLAEAWRTQAPRALSDALPERRPGAPAPLWRCPRCGRRFANRNQSHACGRHSLATHFRGKPARIRGLYTGLLAAVRAIGPVTVIPEKTRIAFQARMSFAVAMPRRGWLDGHLVLARRIPHARFRRIDTVSPRNHVHLFRLTDPAEIDAEFRGWLAEAYAVGQQRHLGRRTSR